MAVLLVVSIATTSPSTTTNVVLQVDPLLASGRLHGWLGVGQFRFVTTLIARQTWHACPTLLRLRRRDRTLFILSVVRSERMTLFWAVSLSVVVTVIAMLRQAAAAGPLLWINPTTTGGGAIWALELKAWLGVRRIESGIRRFGLVGALVVRQRG
jgi:hypothetical protein